MAKSTPGRSGTSLAIPEAGTAMKKTLIFPLIFVGFWGVACGGDGARRGNQKSFETVQEGSASGVTSTIQGPGESLPPITGTNADTTTSFSIDPNVASAAAPAPMPGSGTLGGTLPSQPAPSPYPQPYTPPPMTSASQPRTVYVPPAQPRTRPAEQPPAQQPPQPQQVEPQPQPPATDTTATQQPPQQTQTAAPAPPEQKPPADEAEEPEEDPPPPPTTTDTRGQ
jgi:hypothetical protein